MPINYSFTPGGASLQTETPDYREYIDGFRKQRQPEARVGGGPVRYALPPAPEEHRLPSLAERNLEQAKQEAQLAQLRAISGRAPLRTSFVAGQRVDTPDENAMTGAQRQAFLPNSAGMGALGPSGASLAPLEQRGPREESSQFGYDYLSPVDQARYRAALLRSSGGRG